MATKPVPTPVCTCIRGRAHFCSLHGCVVDTKNEFSLCKLTGQKYKGWKPWR